MKFVFFLTLLIRPALSPAQIINFDTSGRQLIKFDLLGDAVAAHDGEIAQFNGVYYLYGTSYDCGYEWGNKDAPFCGFKVYTSKDLNNWEDKGYLFDAKTAIWQARCNGKTYGCYRPHVIFNKKTALYVLWINVYDNQVGYRVFTSKSPAGPFMEVAEPKLAVNADMPVAGLNNGDHDTFVDVDGRAYLAYTDWRSSGAIIIEELSDDYLTGTGKHVKSVTSEKTEAPCLFKRNNLYYVIYSDPNCGYCSGTGTSYKTAPSPLGPWSDPISISKTSCGGQPAFVSVLKINSQNIYIYGSDLWNNAAKNEALANYYWAPLSFTATGAINPLSCDPAYIVEKKLTGKIKVTDESKGYSFRNDITPALKYAQAFTASRSGKLQRISISLFKNKYPDAPLMIELYKGGEDGQLVGDPVYALALTAGKLGWSPKNIDIRPGLHVKKGEVFIIVLRTNASNGNYGTVVNEEVTEKGGGLAVAPGNEAPFMSQDRGSIKFQTTIIPR